MTASHGSPNGPPWCPLLTAGSSSDLLAGEDAIPPRHFFSKVSGQPSSSRLLICPERKAEFPFSPSSTGWLIHLSQRLPALAVGSWARLSVTVNNRAGSSFMRIVLGRGYVKKGTISQPGPRLRLVLLVFTGTVTAADKAPAALTPTVRAAERKTRQEPTTAKSGCSKPGEMVLGQDRFQLPVHFKGQMGHF